MAATDSSIGTPTANGGRMRYSTANKVGFVLAMLLGIIDIGSVFFPTPDGSVGPPFAILVLMAALGVITLVGVTVGWRRGSRAAIRGAAAARVLSALLTLPAFFAPEVPDVLKVAAGAFTLATIVALVLMLRPAADAS